MYLLWLYELNSLRKLPAVKLALILTFSLAPGARKRVLDLMSHPTRKATHVREFSVRVLGRSNPKRRLINLPHLAIAMACLKERVSNKRQTCFVFARQWHLRLRPACTTTCIVARVSCSVYSATTSITDHLIARVSYSPTTAHSL